tara:strand:- start:10 stop:261 length:252 start_codon:yes stop_codon:yes gene_type:complete
MSNTMDKKINNDTTTDTTTDTIKNEIKFAKTWDKAFGKNMDEDNKKALNVMKTEGADAAVKHMFTDQETGQQLSYSEMRMRYG